MKNFISALFLFFCVLFLGLFFNFIVGLLFSNKVAYNAFSQTTEGVKFIDENNVKFLSDRVVSTFWTDFYINKKGHFIYDYSEDFVNERFSYKDLDEEYVKRYGLQPNFSWWELYGEYMIIGAGFFLSLFGKWIWDLLFFIIQEFT